jgi:hypothetical protein
MASLFNVSLGPPEPTDQEISEALLAFFVAFVYLWVARSRSQIFAVPPPRVETNARVRPSGESAA